LAEWGVDYIELPLCKDYSVDIRKLEKILSNRKIKLILIQRSSGYGWRPSLSVDSIREVISHIKSISPKTFVLVDNCYGEFTEREEPSSVGADLTVGSLIKNPGGGIAPTGAYAAGTFEAIEMLSYRLTSPGIGREVGANPHGHTAFYQGLFMAPHIVCQALKGSALAGLVFERLGYDTLPRWNEPRYDVIQSIRFKTADELIAFCQAVQSASPVDGHVIPYPWDMPGYDHQVIMAAGTFVQGASIELTADAPIKEPYVAYLQGGLTYAHVKIALMHVLTRMLESGHITLNNKKF
jgi:cystathionine beta-lyase family protein involved in aluminum resistance